MTTHHLLLTRFNLRADPDRSPPDDHWLRERARLFGRFTVPSVRHQTTTDFSWLIFCDIASPRWLLDFLAADTPDARVVTLPAFSGAAVAEAVAAELKTRDAKRVITTRLDNDDAIGRSFIATVQAAAETRRDVAAINVLHGCQLAGDRLFLRSDPSNAFISLVENATSGSIRTVFDREHQSWIDEVSVHQVVAAPLWLQVIHASNLANRLSGLPTRPSKVQSDFAVTLPPDPTSVAFARQRAMSVARLAFRVARSPARLLWLWRVAHASATARRRGA